MPESPRVPAPDIATAILVVIVLFFLLAAAIFQPIYAKGAARARPAAARV